MTIRTLDRSILTTDLDRPVAVAVDSSNDRLVIADAGDGELLVIEAASPGTPTVLDGNGTNPTSGVTYPLDVAVAADGTVIVLDAGARELDAYDYDASADSYTPDPGFLGGNRDTLAGVTLDNPTALYRRGTDLFVLDNGNNRVVKVDLSTDAATEVVTGAAWSHAVGLAVDSTGRVYVSDAVDDCLYVFDGSTVTTVGSYGTAQGSFRRPGKLAVDDSDHLYVVDVENRRIQQFDPNGTFVDSFGTPADLGSIHGIAVAGDSVYVADLSRGAIHEYSTATTGPQINVDPGVLDVGRLEVGYSLDVAVTVQNDGNQPLSITDVTTNGPQFTPVDTTATVAPGARTELRVRFTPEASVHTRDALLIENDDNGQTNVLLQGRGVEPVRIEAALVLDRSGSMRQPAGAQSKMDTLARAADTFVDLMRPDVGDKLTVVAFDDRSTTVLPLTEITDEPPSGRALAKQAIGTVTPNGTTSIGAGLEQARAQFDAPPGENTRRVLVVVSDGMENAPPYVIPEENQIGIDPGDYADFEIHTIGLGFGSEVDLTVLSQLAAMSESVDGGSFHVTEDDWLMLQKFFIEIFADAAGEYVALDPKFIIGPGATNEIPVELGPPDHAVTAAVYWDDPTRTLDVSLRTPNGDLIDAASATDDIRRAAGDTYTLYEVDLPLASMDDAHAGTWNIVVSGDRQAGSDTTFAASAIVDSDLGIECGVIRDAATVGLPATVEATLTHFGLPVTASTATIELDRPAFSRGDILAAIVGEFDPNRDGDKPNSQDKNHSVPIGSDLKGGSPVVSSHSVTNGSTDRVAVSDGTVADTDSLFVEVESVATPSHLSRVVSPPHVTPNWRGDWLREGSIGERLGRLRWLTDLLDRMQVEPAPSTDYATPVTRDALAAAVADDDRLAERLFDDYEIELTDEPPISIDLDPLDTEGVFHARLIVEYIIDGQRLRRECSHAIPTVSVPSMATTTGEILLHEHTGDSETFVVQLTPRDAAGNLIGPGVLSREDITVESGEIAAIEDRGDGSYELSLCVPVTTDGPDWKIEDVDDIGPVKADALASINVTTAADARRVAYDELLAISGIGPALAARIRTDASQVADTAALSMSARGQTLRWRLSDLMLGVEATDPEQTDSEPSVLWHR